MKDVRDYGKNSKFSTWPLRRFAKKTFQFIIFAKTKAMNQIFIDFKAKYLDKNRKRQEMDKIQQKTIHGIFPSILHF